MIAAAVDAFALVGLAELGDKSQLLCLTLAASWGWRPVWTGASAAFVLLNALGVTVGAALAHAIPDRWLLVATGVLFVAFGLWTLRASAAKADEVPEIGRSPVWTSFLLFLGAEMGDKTQLTVASLAAAADPLGTFLGASAALIAVSGLGAAAGGFVERRISRVWVQRIAAAVFVAVGVQRLWVAWSA